MGALWYGLNYCKEAPFGYIKQVRCSKSLAIHRTWQYGFYWPFVPCLSRQENIGIEKLLDQLVFAPLDYSIELRENKIMEIIKKLFEHNIVPKCEDI